MDSVAQTNEPQKPKGFNIDFRSLSLLLIAAIAILLFIWKPWAAELSDRVITVTGEATVKAEPDEYGFSPNYQFANKNKDEALAAITKKSDEVLAKLKELGVPDSKIKTNSSGYDYMMYPTRDDGETTYTLNISVTVDNKDLAQKVQDYLLTTTPTGQVTPTYAFSDEKRKTLESEARDKATKEARTKADQSAKNLGFKVVKVKSVEDGSGFGGVVPLGLESGGVAVPEDQASKLNIQPGENELYYSVTVVYYVR